MTPAPTFTCSICGEPSQTICVYCTKDACGNHLCERCSRCSDCCECEVHLQESHADRAPPAHETEAPLETMFVPPEPVSGDV